MKNKTLQDFKDEVSKEYGIVSLSEHTVIELSFRYAHFLDTAAERYATYKAEQACIRQREICAEKADTRTESMSDHDGGYNDFQVIDKESILQAPLATELCTKK